MRDAMRLLVIMVLCGAVLNAQGAAKQAIEGVWKVSEIVVTGAGASTISSPQPSLFIFTRSHYSIMYVPGSKPRALKKAEAATTDEKIAAFDSFVANAGAYELAGSTLTIRPIVARDPNYMVGGFNKYQFRIDGNTLTLTNKSTDLNMRFGEQVMPSKAPASETRIKLVRME
jgi:Lipocalin-like domain